MTRHMRLQRTLRSPHRAAKRRRNRASRHTRRALYRYYAATRT